jgi:molybdopterin converting factor small subunit
VEGVLTEGSGFSLPREMIARRMRVTIHYFASLRDRKGRDSEAFELEAGLTLRELYQHLFPPDSSPTPPPVLFVQDEEYVIGDTPVRDGAEVAFIPPLGGG